MITYIPEQIKKLLLDGTPQQRKYVCGKEFAYFLFYYFYDYLTYELAPFHWAFIEDCYKLANGDLDEAAWIAFRESAKTTIAKIYVTWLICYRKKRYIAWDSYDGTNAEAALFDITIFLQTNPRIRHDFGILYRKRRRNKTKEELEDDEPTMKRIGNFLTENKVRCEAFTTQKSARGRISGKYRPDFFVFDDIENNITKRSPLMTAKIIEHIGEVRSGLGPNASVLYLGNFITEDGSVAYIMNGLGDREGKVVRNVPVIDPQTKLPAWPAKHTLTNAEALKHNAGRPRDKWKISLEKKKEDLNMDGKRVFETEMLNDPGLSGDYFFERAIIKKLMEKAADPIKEVAGFKTWAAFNASHRYAGGADTAEGIGGDSHASAIIDFTQTPNLLAGIYVNNEISPTVFAHEVTRHGEIFGECFYVPEINNTGYATVGELINLGYTNLYIREVKNKTTNKMQKEYGFRTSSGTKHEILSQLKGVVEDGALEILDKDTLAEMYHMTKDHVRMLKTDENMTRHFDRVMAVALAWEGHKYATLSKKDKQQIYKAPNQGDYIV